MFNRFYRTLVGAAVLLSAWSPSASAQTCSDAYTLIQADDNAQAVGVHTYRIYVGEQVGEEVIDTIDLLDSAGQFIGQIMGGIIRGQGELQDYIFVATDLVGLPPFQTLAGGTYVYFYIEETHVGLVKTTGETGEMRVVRDLGIGGAARTVQVQAAVLSDPSIRRILTGSPASQWNSDTRAADEDCPIWVITTACATCAACAFVAEIPPPCWGACVTCGVCIGLEIPKPTPNPTPTPPTPRPRPYPKPCVTFAGDTLVHTPRGVVEIQSLAVGDTVLSLQPNGRSTVAQVTFTGMHEDHIASVMYIGGDAIQSTRGHMMMSPLGWIPSERIGTSAIRDVQGRFVPVTSLSACEAGISSDETASVCQILVSGGTGYFVGETGLYAEAH